MGWEKSEMMQRDELEAEAREIAIEAGALKTCLFHPYVTIRTYDDDAEGKVYAMATNRCKHGMANGTREEFMDAMKHALSHAPDHCCR